MVWASRCSFTTAPGCFPGNKCKPTGLKFSGYLFPGEQPGPEGFFAYDFLVLRDGQKYDLKQRKIICQQKDGTGRFYVHAD